MKDYVTIEETNWIEEFETLFSKLEEADAPNVLEEIKQFISKLISQEKEKWNESVVKMLEDTDVQMSVNGDVSQDEIAMAKFIYKAHIKHIIKKIGSAIIPPNPINGTLPSETDSATK